MPICVSYNEISLELLHHNSVWKFSPLNSLLIELQKAEEVVYLELKDYSK